MPPTYFDTTWLDVTGQSHVREIDSGYSAESALVHQTTRRCGHTAARSNAGISTMRHKPTQTGPWTAYTNLLNDTPSLPWSTTTAVFAKDSRGHLRGPAWLVGRLASETARCIRSARRDVDDVLVDVCQVALAGPEGCKFHFEYGHHYCYAMLICL